MEIALHLNHEENNLIQACVRRERWAQKALYEEYYSAMMGVCLRFANNQDEALDILHGNAILPGLREGDYLAFLNAGGYGSSMSSNHCMRGRFSEYLVV